MRALIVAALLLAAGPALAAAPSPDATSRKEQGDSRRDAGDNTGALAAYREAVQLSPGFVEAWEEIGKLYFAAKRFREASEAFQHAVDADPSYSNNWFNLALARRRAGDLELARDAFRRYVGLKPDDADGRFRLADVLRSLDDREGAIREYEAVAAAADAHAAPPELGSRAKDALAQLRAGAGAPAGVRPVPTIVKVSPAAAEPAPAAAPSPAALPSPTPTPPAPVAPAVPVVSAPAPVPAARPVAEPIAPPSPALLDKLALGDKLHAAGDYRGALFAYQDAVYLEPRNASARVKLGRAYWILRYVGQADEQWQQATQLASNDPSIARQIEEARKAPRPAIANGEPPKEPGAGSAPAGAPGGASRPPEGPRVYKFTPDGQGGATPPSPSQLVVVPREPSAGSTPGYGMPPAQPDPGAAPPYPSPAGQPAYPQQGAQPSYPPAQQPAYPQPTYQQPVYQQPSYPQQAYQPPPQPQAYPPPQYAQPAYPPAQPQYAPPQAAPAQPSASAAAAAQHYRAAISLYVQRDYLGAIAELDAAITLDPNLSVAYTARGSSKFGLRKYREAAADYKAALDLDATKAEPIWGLAECQRMLGDPAAVDTYRRYAASIASDVNEERRSRARRWATELSSPRPQQ